MNAIGAIRQGLKMSKDVLHMYLKDLSDADLLIRPVPGANHIAWQLGHLIAAEPFLMRTELPDAKYPELPPGFAEKHTKETSKLDTGFQTKAEYVDLSKKMRAATLALLDGVSDSDLERAGTGRMAKFCPRLADLFLLVSNHTLMHAGQFTVVRRKLGKPVLF